MWANECADRAEKIVRELLERGADPALLHAINVKINAAINSVCPHARLSTVEREPADTKRKPEPVELRGILLPSTRSAAPRDE